MLIDPSGLASELPDAPSFERALLAELRRHVGFDSAFLAVKGETPTVINVDYAKLAPALRANDYEGEIATTKAVAFAARGVAVDTAVHGEQGVRRFGYFRDLAAPVNGRHSLLAFPMLRGRSIGGLMLGRCGENFKPREIACVESILPQLAVARASYGLVWGGSPLPTPQKQSFASRTREWIHGSRPLKTVPGDATTLHVRDRRGFREMVAEGAAGELVWSRADVRNPSRSGWFYVDLFHLAASRARRRSRVLFIGCGGGVAVRQFATVYPGVAIDVVEWDARVVELAYELFALGEVPNVSVFVGDGVEFVAHAPASQWDVIVVDAYDESELASGFPKPQFFANAKRALRPGGALAFNAIGMLAGPSPVQEVESAARQHLSDVRLVPVMDVGETYSSSALRNVVIVGGKDDS